MKTLTILILAAVFACHAQTTTTPTIKGHTLGESFQQFITKSNDVTREQMQKCQTKASDKKEMGSAEAALNDYKFSERCKDFLHTLNAPSMNGTFNCADPAVFPADEVEKLRALAPDKSAADFTQEYIDRANVSCFEFSGTPTFDGNRLVEISLRFGPKAWDAVLADVVSKFGKPTETQIDTVQNAYGAKFDLQRVTWITHEYVVVAFEKLNLPYSLVRLVEVHITDHAYFQKQQAQKTHGNALD